MPRSLPSPASETGVLTCQRAVLQGRFCASYPQIFSVMLRGATPPGIQNAQSRAAGG